MRRRSCASCRKTTSNALLSRIYLHAFLLTGAPLYRRVVEETLAYVLREMTSPPLEIAVVGDPQEEGARALLQAVFHYYVPNKVVACGKDSDVFLLKDRAQISTRPTAYVCRNNACQVPITSPTELAKHLPKFGEIR